MAKMIIMKFQMSRGRALNSQPLVLESMVITTTPWVQLNAVWLKINETFIFKGTRGVQHGVWTHLHAFWIIRESIDITMLKPYIMFQAHRAVMIQQQ